MRLELTWTGSGVSGAAVGTCYAFVVADAALFVKEGRVKKFFLQPGSSD